MERRHGADAGGVKSSHWLGWFPLGSAGDVRRGGLRACGKQFNERSGTLLNRAQYPSDVIALVVLWRLRCKLSLRDLPEMFALRGMVFSHEAVREWALSQHFCHQGPFRVTRGL